MKELQIPLEEEVEKMEMDSEMVPENLETMTEDEALRDLQMERVPIYQGLEKILCSRSPLARRIVDYLKETYPEQIPLFLASHQMEELLDQRIQEAKEMYATLHPKYQKAENVENLDTMQRIQTENQIAAMIWEQIDQEVLYRPLTF